MDGEVRHELVFCQSSAARSHDTRPSTQAGSRHLRRMSSTSSPVIPGIAGPAGRLIYPKRLAAHLDLPVRGRPEPGRISAQHDSLCSTAGSGSTPERVPPAGDAATPLRLWGDPRLRSSGTATAEHGGRSDIATDHRWALNPSAARRANPSSKPLHPPGES
jgi:hypothetical protein